MADLPPKVAPSTIVRGSDAAYGRLIDALEHKADPEDAFLRWTDLLIGLPADPTIEPPVQINLQE